MMQSGHTAPRYVRAGQILSRLMIFWSPWAVGEGRADLQQVESKESVHSNETLTLLNEATAPPDLLSVGAADHIFLTTGISDQAVGRIYEF